MSSKNLRKLPTPTFMFLNLKETGGADLLGDMPAKWEDGVGASRGERWTRNTGEYPSAAVGSSLSAILEANVPAKYFLSEKACWGILNRAEKRGRPLPKVLKEALELQGSRQKQGQKQKA